MSRFRKLFRYGYLDDVRRIALAGYTSNAEIAKYLNVSEMHVKNWRETIPEFDRACESSTMQAHVLVAETAFQAALNGSEAMMRFYLERRVEAYKPKQEIDHTSGGATLASLLAEQGRMSEEEAAERGLIEYEDEEQGTVYGRARARDEDAYPVIDAEDDDRDEFDEDGFRR